MISLMCYFIEKEMDDKQREQFRNSLEHPGYMKAKAIKAPTVGKIVPIDPKQRWRAPKGWTPPGWDEQKSYAAAQQFMGFKATVK